MDGLAKNMYPLAENEPIRSDPVGPGTIGNWNSRPACLTPSAGF
jgi:hypothetical protein